MSAKRNLEHCLWARLKSDGLTGARFLIACSGGRDSVALVRAFAAVRPVGSLVIANVHHGAGEIQQVRHRDEAREMVRALASGLGAEYRGAAHDGASLKSEADFRRERRRLLEELRLATGCDLIVTAHHARDLLETRLLHLIRGSGGAGLRSLRALRPPWYRPWLEIEVTDIADYLRDINQNWCEDPSNAGNDYLRNWLRNEWLPQLDERRQGGVANLARSLSQCADELAKTQSQASEAFLLRAEWESWPFGERRRRLARLLLDQGCANFTRGQLDEVIRRLDNSRKEHTFRLAGCVWEINAEQIRAIRPDKVL